LPRKHEVIRLRSDFGVTGKGHEIVSFRGIQLAVTHEESLYAKDFPGLDLKIWFSFKLLSPRFELRTDSTTDERKNTIYLFFSDNQTI